MNWILDLACVAVIVIFIVINAKKGFVRTFVTVIGFVLAVAVSLAASGPAARIVYSALVEEKLAGAIADTAAQSTDSDAIAATLFENRLVSLGISAAGMTESELAEKIEASAVSGAESLADAVCGNIVGPLIIRLLDTIIFVIMMIILMIAVRFAAAAINKIFSAPLIGGANSFFGGVLGAVEGAAAVLLAVAVISLMMKLSGGTLGPIDARTIESTHVFKAFYALI